MTNIRKAHPQGRIPTAELARHEEECLETSSKLFRDHGFANVSVDMIARAARISPKTIYSRYGGKSGLFTAVIKRMVAPVLASQQLLGHKHHENPVSELRDFAAAFLDRILEPNALAMYRMLIAEAIRMPELAELFYKEGPVKNMSQLAEWLASQHDAGLLRVPDPKSAAEVFIALIEGELMRRALMLNVVPGPEERALWLENAITVFSRAYAPSSEC